MFMPKDSHHLSSDGTSPGGHRVFEARLSEGSLTLHELDAGPAARIYRRWLAALDAKAASLTCGKPSDDVARTVLELAESFLKNNEIKKAVTVLRLVADSTQFDGTQEHALAVAALKNLRPRR
jgi:hypothetical protein